MKINNNYLNEQLNHSLAHLNILPCNIPILD